MGQRFGFRVNHTCAPRRRQRPLRLILREWEGVNALLALLLANRKEVSPAV
jgi:hypothetical protein